MSTLSRSRLTELAGLARRRERARLGLFLVEGVRAVESAIAAGAQLEALVLTAAAGEDARVAAAVARAGVPVHRVSARDMDRLSGATSAQGVVALARSVVQDFQSPPAGAALALDGVQDPGNVGTLVRSAAWFGLRAVILGPGSADPESPKVARSAAGALWDVQLLRAPDLPAALTALAAAGARVYGADVGGTAVRDWHPRPGDVLVLGGEANGLSPQVRDTVHEIVEVPRAGAPAGVESLNVAVAGGILMHHWRVSA